MTIPRIEYAVGRIYGTTAEEYAVAFIGPGGVVLGYLSMNREALMPNGVNYFHEENPPINDYIDAAECPRQVRIAIGRELRAYRQAFREFNADWESVN